MNSPIQENPVGDVQARIRKLLTEGDADGVTLPMRGATNESEDKKQSSTVSASQQSQTSATQQKNNPFRGSGALGVAVGGIMKTLSGGDASESVSTPASRQVTKTSPASSSVPNASGDLFDDDGDTELDIPAFLRKKKIG